MEGGKAFVSTRRISDGDRFKEVCAVNSSGLAEWEEKNQREGMVSVECPVVCLEKAERRVMGERTALGTHIRLPFGRALIVPRQQIRPFPRRGQAIATRPCSIRRVPTQLAPDSEMWHETSDLLPWARETGGIVDDDAVGQMAADR